jgi:transposase
LKELNSVEDLESANREELVELIKIQARIILEQQEQIEELEKLVRGNIRSAAPFSKGKPKKDKKKSGRRPGKGKFNRRREPQPKPEDKVEQIEVTLKDRQCPDCGTSMEVSLERASIEDVPAEPTRWIRIFVIEVGQCPRCGRKLRAEHPDLAEDQHGASAHRVGDNAYAQALSLHYHSGLPLRKVPEVIETSNGITLTQSALTQKAKRLCLGSGLLGVVYKGLKQELRKSEVINTDDTGWRTGGLPSYLMGFFTNDLALYQIRDRHRNQEVREMIGENYEGILGTDRGPSYDAKELEYLRQQKCLSHLLKNLSEVEESKTGASKWFTSVLKRILREGLKIWEEHTSGRMSEEEFRRRGREVEAELSEHLRDRELSDADNQRMLDGIGWHHARGSVLLFLKNPEVEPTNNRAERGLRPAVISRKVSHCSKNGKGAKAYETMKSITTTIKLRGFSVAKTLADLIRGKPMPVAR